MFEHVSAIQHAMGLQGSYWFSYDTMKSFNTKILDDGYVWGGQYFITWEGIRASFTDRLVLVRKVVADDSGKLSIETPNKDGFKTVGQAREFIQSLGVTK